MNNIAVVMTVYNRVDKTKLCIDSLINNFKRNKMCADFYITNDGSTDNTHELIESYVTEECFHFTELFGNGNLYWNKGMFLAYGNALAVGYDYYLWVNNDVVFRDDFLYQMLEDAKVAFSLNTRYIICGSTSYSNSQNTSYGGSLNLSSTNPYKRKLLKPIGSIQKCDCINGNCLLVSRDAAINIGNLEYKYEHGFGDYDYGYTLGAAGGQCFVASSFVGECNRNTSKGTWKDTSLTLKKRFKLKNYPIGQPLYSHSIFLRKWFPKLWVYYLMAPYINIIITSLEYRLRKIKSKESFNVENIHSSSDNW